MNISTPVWENYTAYLNSMEWRRKKLEWLYSGRPIFCWACEEPAPMNLRGFNLHHISYTNVGNEKLNDLVLLCSSDHHRLSSEYKDLKSRGVSLAQWTWAYISLTRWDLGLKKISESKIAQFMGEME